MDWPLIALALFAAVVLIVVKVFRAQIEQAGAPLIIPLVVIVIAAVGLTVYHNQKEELKDTGMDEMSEGGPAGMGGGRGGGGGRSSWRERFQQTIELAALVRKLPLMDKQEGVGLSKEQAASLAPLFQSLATDEKLTQDQAKAKIEATKKVLTPPQLEALGKIELPRRRFGRRRGGTSRGGAGGPPGEVHPPTAPTTEPTDGKPAEPPPPAPAGEARPAPTGADASRPAARPGEARPERGGPGSGRRSRRGGFSPDMNPFLREWSKPALTELLDLLDKRQKGVAPVPEAPKPTDTDAKPAPTPDAAKEGGE